jgi:hypothetical protein
MYCSYISANNPRERAEWRPIREKRDRDRDQPPNEVRVSVAAMEQDRLAVGARSRLAFQPYLADAAPHLVAFIVGILPIVERSEIARMVSQSAGRSSLMHALPAPDRIR